MRARTLLAVSLLIAGAFAASRIVAAQTPLIDAVKSGKRQEVRALVKRQTDVNVPEADGTTALHWAARADDAETVAVLLAAGAHAKTPNRYGVTPLALAAGNGNAAIIEVLLKAGADPHASREGETALMTAARSGRAEAVKVLLAHGARVNAREGWQEQTALMWAASDNQTEVVKALLDGGAEVDARAKVLAGAPVGRGRGSETSFQSAHSTFPRGGFTPLLFAARDGANGAVRVLVEAGADVNLADPDGVTPAMMAIINGHYDLAAFLIERPGFDVNAVDKAGRGALYYAVDMHTLEWLFSRPTPKPSGDLDSVDVVRRLLARGANPNAQLTGRPFTLHHDSGGHPSLVEGATPFLKAASTSDLTLMRLLIEHGADPNRTTKNKTTALMLAAGLEWREIASLGTERDSLDAIRLCLDRGADVNAANEAGETALHGAAQRGAEKVVQLLFERGGRLDAKNRSGRTPLDEAIGQAANAGGDTARRPERPGTQVLIRQLMARSTAGARP